MADQWLNEDYQEAVLRMQELNLVIVGNDPFPTDPTAVPFLKGSWQEMRPANCSGQYVLESITGASFQEIEERYHDRALPLDFATTVLLERYGVALLNSRYGPGHERGLRRSWAAVNRTLLGHAHRLKAQIILCGRAKSLSPYIDLEFKSQAEEVIHPDLRNKNNFPDRWAVWWDVGALNRGYNLPAWVSDNEAAAT